MADSKLQEFKKPIILVAILLLVLVGFIANRARVNRSLEEAKESLSISTPTNQFANRTLDIDVLEDEKFKELKPIPKYEFEGIEISEDELANVKKRYGNPFKPFN